MLSPNTSSQPPAASSQRWTWLSSRVFAQPSNLNPQRTGATLVEILMSVLIVSVGMTAVIGLFPLSLIYSLEATQLTNAKLLEESVVEFLRTNPQVVEGGFSPWEPSTTYAANSFAVIPPDSGRVLSGTNMLFFTSGGGLSYFSQPLFDRRTRGNTVEPELVPMTGVTWTAYRLEDLKNPGATPLNVSGLSSRYIIDPLGYHNIADPTAADYAVDSLNTRFGANDDASDTAAGYDLLLRHNAGLTAAQAAQFFSLSDSWTSDLEVVPSDLQLVPTMTPTQTEITFPPNTDLSQISPGMRLVLTASSGSGTFTYVIQGTDSVTGNVLTINSATALPDDFDTLAEVSQARFETYARRYSYLLSVNRKWDGAARITCPIFFNRSFTALDERVIDSAVPAGGSDTVQVRWARGGGRKDPPISTKGGYLFDAVNGEWYRIIQAAITMTTTVGTATVTLDRAMPATTDNDPSTPDADAAVIFMPGIVHVFDLEL